MKKVFLSLVFLAYGLAAASQSDMYHYDKVYHHIGRAFYRIISDSTVELCPQQCIDGHCLTWDRTATIPARVTILGQSYTVNRIADSAFFIRGTSTLSILLPPTIVEIGKDAFRDGRAPITLPESVRVIGQGAFASFHREMDEFHIPRNVEQIGEGAFAYTQIKRFTIDSGNRHYIVVDSVALCTPDTTLLLAYAAQNDTPLYIVPSPVRRLGEGSFSGDTILRTLILPDGLREIGRLLTDRSLLPNLHIPASVCRIEGPLCDTASPPFNLTVDPASSHYKMVDNQLMSRDGDTLLMVLGAEGEYTVPDGVCVLGDRLFYYNQKLTQVHLPDSLTAIGDETFSYSTADATLPSSLRSIGYRAFRWNTGTKNVSLPNLTHMGEEAVGYSSIQRVDRIRCLREIPEMAVMACAKLQSFTLGDQVETLGAYAFASCSFPGKPIVMPAALRRIGRLAYYIDFTVKSITLLGRVDTIGDSAFKCRVLHLCDTHMPYIYPTALAKTDTVYTPCGYAEAFEQGIRHPEGVVFADWCEPLRTSDPEPMPDFSLFPNPAREAVTLTVSPSLTDLSHCRLTLHNAAGRELLSLLLVSPYLTVPTAHLPAGLYLITLHTPQGTVSSRLVVE